MADRPSDRIRAGLAGVTCFDRALADGDHATVLAQTIAETPGLKGSVLHDVHTAVLLREHGIRQIVTRDADFHGFRFLEVVDPLRPSWPDGVHERRSTRTSRSRARSKC